MTCMEAQALITPFINDTLNVMALEPFLDHVHECKECREELEVYYALLTAMKQLDEDESVSSNYTKALKQKLTQAREYVRKTRRKHIRKRMLFLGTTIVIGLFTGMSVNVVEEVLTTSREVEQNRFLLKQEQFSPYMTNTLFEHIKLYEQTK